MTSSQVDAKGPEWENFKHVPFGRIVKSNGRTGIVMCSYALDPLNINDNKFQVRWLEAEDKWGAVEEIAYPDLEDIMTDTFADQDLVLPLIAALQKNNWHPLPQDQMTSLRERSGYNDISKSVGLDRSIPNPPHKEKPLKTLTHEEMEKYRGCSWAHLLSCALHHMDANGNVRAKASIDDIHDWPEYSEMAHLPHKASTANDSAGQADDFSDDDDDQEPGSPRKINARYLDLQVSSDSEFDTGTDSDSEPIVPLEPNPPAGHGASGAGKASKKKPLPKKKTPAGGRGRKSKTNAQGTPAGTSRATPGKGKKQQVVLSDSDEDSDVVIVEDGFFRGITGRLYPLEVCCGPEDLKLSVYKDNPEHNSTSIDYYVESIVDQVTVAGHNFYLVKWEGFELDPGNIKQHDKGSWEPEANLKDVEALDVWESDRPSWFMDKEVPPEVLEKIEVLLIGRRSAKKTPRGRR